MIFLLVSLKWYWQGLIILIGLADPEVAYFGSESNILTLNKEPHMHSSAFVNIEYS